MNLQLTPKVLTKSAIAQAGTEYAQKLLDGGEVSPLVGYMQLRALKCAIDWAMDELKSEAIDEADLYSKGDSIIDGVKFTVRAGRTYYNYAKDATWLTIKAEEKAAADRRKAREGFLRALENEMVDPSTGEFIKPAQVSKYGASVLAITFPK